jgi:hypothetical protein
MRLKNKISAGSTRNTQSSLSLNFDNLTITALQYKLFPVSCSDIGFMEKSIDEVLAQQSGHKLP